MWIRANVNDTSKGGLLDDNLDRLIDYFSYFFYLFVLLCKYLKINMSSLAWVKYYTDPSYIHGSSTATALQVVGFGATRAERRHLCLCQCLERLLVRNTTVLRQDIGGTCLLYHPWLRLRPILGVVCVLFNHNVNDLLVDSQHLCFLEVFKSDTNEKV